MTTIEKIKKNFIKRMYGITRVDVTTRKSRKHKNKRSGSLHGFRVKFMRLGVVYAKWFSDAAYGSSKKALQEAMGYRDSFLRYGRGYTDKHLLVSLLKISGARRVIKVIE